MANLKSSLSVIWVDCLLDFGTPSDPFSSTFLTDESIVESMMLEGEPWEYHHHRSNLQDYEEDNLLELYYPSIKNFFSNYFPINSIESEKKL